MALTPIAAVVVRIRAFDTPGSFVPHATPGHLSTEAVAVFAKARDEFVVLGCRVCAEPGAFQVGLQGFSFKKYSQVIDQ